MKINFIYFFKLIKTRNKKFFIIMRELFLRKNNISGKLFLQYYYQIFIHFLFLYSNAD